MTEYDSIDKLAEETVNEMLYELHHSVSEPVIDCSKIPPQMVKELIAYVAKVLRVATEKD